VVRHRDQVDGLGDAARVGRALEGRERFLVVREPGQWLLEVHVPVADAIQAARDERLVADGARDGQRLTPILAGTRVAPGRPEHA